MILNTSSLGATVPINPFASARLPVPAETEELPKLLFTRHVPEGSPARPRPTKAMAETGLFPLEAGAEVAPPLANTAEEAIHFQNPFSAANLQDIPYVEMTGELLIGIIETEVREKLFNATSNVLFGKDPPAMIRLLMGAHHYAEGGIEVILSENQGRELSGRQLQQVAHIRHLQDLVIQAIENVIDFAGLSPEQIEALLDNDLSQQNGSLGKAIEDKLGGLEGRQQRRQTLIQSMKAREAGQPEAQSPFRQFDTMHLSEFFEGTDNSPYRKEPPPPGPERERMLYGVTSDPDYAIPLLHSAGTQILDKSEEFLRKALLSLRRASQSRIPSVMNSYLRDMDRQMIQIKMMLQVAKNLGPQFGNLDSIQQRLDQAAGEADQLRVGGISSLSSTLNPREPQDMQLLAPSAQSQTNVDRTPSLGFLSMQANA